MTKALLNTQSIARYRADPCAFIEECLVSPYTREPYELVEAERAFIQHAFQLDTDGRLLHPLLVYGAIKKSRKTELAALIVITMITLLGGEYGEANIVANDQKRAVDRCFTACSRIIAASSLLCNEVKCTQDKITFLATGSTITALTNDAAGVAGGHPVISVFDELWTAPAGERGRRMFDALIPVPSRKISCRLVVSHAGIADDNHLLYQLYQRGMQLPQIGDNLYAGTLQWMTSDAKIVRLRRKIRGVKFGRKLKLTLHQQQEALARTKVQRQPFHNFEARSGIHRLNKKIAERSEIVRAASTESHI
jgi:hypothetical protein